MVGSIKGYTKNFKLIIPEFNIATWHDYIEENFRSIDALFQNLFGINGFSGMWKTNSSYTAGQVLFIGPDNDSQYEGRLVKVLKDTTTGGYSTFSEALAADPDAYEVFADASTATVYAELAKDWANKTDGTIHTPEGVDTGEYSAKYYKNVTEALKNDCETLKTQAQTSEQNAKNSQQAALVSQNAAKESQDAAKVSETSAKSSEDSAQSSATSAQKSLQDAQKIVSDFDSHAQNTQDAFDTNAVSKTDAFNDNANDKIIEYNDNNTSKITAFNENYATKLENFNSNATQKTEQVDTIAASVSTLVTGFDENVATKTSEFNSNANSKTQAFNTNASEKQALIDTSALSAQTSETNAKTSENNAKNYSKQAETSATTATQMSNSASNYATTATTQAGIATTQAGIATTKAQDASESASTATSKANIATTKAQEASTSATNASSSATSASNSADLAESWAIGDNTSRPEGSAKYWAEQASAGQLQADWNQTDSSQKDYIKNKPTKLSQFTNDTNFVNTTQLATKQDVSNLSQTIDTSTSKYPSNNAVKESIGVYTYSTTQTYNQNDVVIAVVDDETALYKSLTDDNIDNSLDDDTKWEKLALGGGGDNIGDIKYTCRTDVPSGGAWCDGAEYTQAVFPDIYQMLVDGKLQKTDYATFNSSVSTNGSCGFFALDESAQKFKVPLLKDVYLKAGDTPSMFGAESLPNITGTTLEAKNSDSYTYSSGAFAFEQAAGESTNGFSGSEIYGRGSFSASRSSSTYQDGAKVNPDHVVYRAYVVLYATAAEASEAQAAEFMTALGGKANVGLDNVTPVQSFKDMSIGWGMPDYSAAISTGSGSFTAPLNGWYVTVVTDPPGGATTNFFVNNINIGYIHCDYNNHHRFITPLAKGQTITNDNSSRLTNSYFYPCIGG